MLETWIVPSIVVEGALAAIPRRRHLRPLIEFVLQFPLESHKVLTATAQLASSF
jgi:hypothetical protein